MSMALDRTLILGGNSVLGTSLTAALLDQKCPEIVLTCRREMDPENGVNAPDDDRITTLCCDVRDRNVLEEICATFLASDPEAPANVVYCCGKFGYGKISEFDFEQFEEIFDVMVLAPLLLARTIGSRSSAPSRFVLLTGLGGERTIGPANFAYNSACSSAHQLIAALGLEWSDERPMTKQCLGVALGLVDKGQTWIGEYRSSFPNEIATDFDEAISVILMFLGGRLASANGRTLELNHNTTSYHAIIEMKTGGKL